MTNQPRNLPSNPTSQLHTGEDIGKKGAARRGRTTGDTVGGEEVEEGRVEGGERGGGGGGEGGGAEVGIGTEEGEEVTTVRDLLLSQSELQIFVCICVLCKKSCYCG